MVFGVFDGLHAGHKYFLQEAGNLAEELVVVLPPDEVSKRLKGYAPKNLYDMRMSALFSFNPAFRIVQGDTSPGGWEVIAKEKPDMVFLGYDQGTIANELERRGTPYIVLAAHKPEEYKSSLFKGLSELQ